MELDLPSSSQKAPIRGFKLPLFFNPKLLLIILLFTLLIGSLFVFTPLKSILVQEQILSRDEIATKFKIDKANFYNPKVKDTTIDHLQKANTTKSKEEAKDSYTKAFFLVKNDYGSVPKKEVRDVLIEINKIAVNQYSDLKEVLTPIPCKDDSCGAKFELPEKLESIKKEIFDNKEIDDHLKDVLRVNFDDAALAFGENNKEQQYLHISSIFTNLRTHLKNNDDSKVGEILGEILVILREIDPEKYVFEDSKEFFKF